MKTILFSAIAMALFFGFYLLTLRRSNLFRLRRFYLLATLAFSFVVPFISIGLPTKVSAPVLMPEQVETMPYETTVNQDVVEPLAVTAGTVQAASAARPVCWRDIVWWIYLAGAGISLVLLVVKLSQTLSYYRRSRLSRRLSEKGMRVRVLAEPDGNLPFSFLRSVFVNPDVFTHSELQQVLCHERAHIRQGHTADLLLIEAMRVVQWFNPIIYWVSREMKDVHEYLADEEVLMEGVPTHDYLELLYRQLCEGRFLPVGNSFRHLLTKKRIQMMRQTVKRRRSAWWLLALIPIIAGLLLVNCHPKTEEAVGELVGEEVVDEPEDPVVYDPFLESPDEMPEFPGGIQQYVDNLYGSMKYPELAEKYKLQGIFTVRFIVEKDGRIRHVELDTAYVKWKSEEGGMVAMLGKNGYALAHLDLGDGTSVDEESRNEIVRHLYESITAEFNRAFRAAPACKPAMKDGQPVRCRLRLPAAFTAGENPTAKVTVTDPRSSRAVTDVELVQSDGQTGPRFLRVLIDTFPCETFVMQD